MIPSLTQQLPLPMVRPRARMAKTYPDLYTPIHTAAPSATVDPEAMGQLQALGFPELRCRKALLATGNAGAENAMQWLFAHMDDPGRHWVSPSPPTHCRRLG